MKSTILDVWKERQDAWSHSVQARLLHVHDLHAADAIFIINRAVLIFRPRKIFHQHFNKTKQALIGKKLADHKMKKQTRHF